MDIAGPSNGTENAKCPIAQESTNVHYVMYNMQGHCAPDPLNNPTLVSPTINLRENKVKVPLILPTPVKVQVLDKYLEDYNQDDRQFIIKGFSEGFPLGVVVQFHPQFLPIILQH